MKTSSEFTKFGKYFIQDIELMLLPGEEIFDFPLKIFKGNDRILLQKFIDKALQECSDAELMQLWNSVDSDIYFPTAKDLRAMLMGARERLR